MTDLFKSADTELDNSYEPEGVTANPGLVDTLVGEGKKYKTPDDLAYSKLAADAHIKRIAEENAALRKALEEKQALEALVAELRGTTTKTEQAISSQTGDESAQAIDPKTLVDQVRAQLKQEQDEQEYARNRDTVKRTIIAALGPNFQGELRNRLASAGLDESTANTLANKNPNAFLKLIDVNPGTTRGTPPPPAPMTRVNNTELPTGSGERTKSYWDGVKKQMGVKAFNENRALVTQMHNDALRLKEKFFDK